MPVDQPTKRRHALCIALDDLGKPKTFGFAPRQPATGLDPIAADQGEPL